MGEKQHKFPEYFPKDCPPNEAKDESLVIFRLCKGNIPKEEDFKSFYEINPSKYKSMINAYGLSVFLSKEDCDSARRKSAALRKKCPYCAYGENNPDRGRILQTPSKANPAHYTWWVYEGIKPHLFFKTCIEKGGDNNE